MDARDTLVQSTVKYQRESRLVSTRKATNEEIAEMVRKAERHERFLEENKRYQRKYCG